MMPQLRFNTDDLPERDRFPAFCEEMVRRYAALDMERTEDCASFRGNIALQQVGASAISTIAATPVRFLRTPKLVSDGDDALCIFLCVAGAAEQTQRLESHRLAAGAGIVCDNAYSGALEVRATSQFWCVKVARSRLAELVPASMPFAGARLDRDPAALRLLLSHLAHTRDIDLADSPQAARSYDEHLVDLMALALGAQGDSRALVESRSVRAVRRDAVLRIIADALADPELSIGSVAQRLGITPRYVNMLLDETGLSFSEHLLDKRLAHAAVLLSDPRHRVDKISTVAFECGFGDLSYFNRTFRRRYSATPSEWRAAAQKNEGEGRA